MKRRITEVKDDKNISDSHRGLWLLEVISLPIVVSLVFCHLKSWYFLVPVVPSHPIRLCFMMRFRFNAGDDSSRNCIKYLKQRENFGKISFPFLIKNAWNGCRVKYQFRVVDFKIFEQFYWNSLLSFLKVCLLKFFDHKVSHFNEISVVAF